MLFCSGDTITVNLGLLKPLWHLYLKLTSKYSSSDNAMRPPLLRALTELFLAVEVAAEVSTVSFIFVISVFFCCLCNLLFGVCCQCWMHVGLLSYLYITFPPCKSFGQ